MYKIFRLIAIAFPLMLVSCGPTYFSLGVDMRLPSRSGIVLTGKNMSVTYLDNGTDSLFMSSVAEGFAQALEKVGGLIGKAICRKHFQRAGIA